MYYIAGVGRVGGGGGARTHSPQPFWSLAQGGVCGLSFTVWGGGGGGPGPTLVSGLRLRGVGMRV